MLRVRALVVALLVGALLGGFSATALADAGADRPASFCSTARRVGDDFSQLDPSDLTDEDALEDLRDAAERLSKQAPRSLKRPFRTVIDFYDDVVEGGLDVSDADSVEEIARRADKVARAASRIIDHLVDKCDVSLE
jgi:hypothetical protein